MVTIRQFEKTDSDYEKAISVVNRVWPEDPDTVDELKEGDDRRAAKMKWARFLAEADGEVVGVAKYSQSSHLYHPNRFWVSIDESTAKRVRRINRWEKRLGFACVFGISPLKLT
jgi:hypothetical protein